MSIGIPEEVEIVLARASRRFQRPQHISTIPQKHFSLRYADAKDDGKGMKYTPVPISTSTRYYCKRVNAFQPELPIKSITESYALQSDHQSRNCSANTYHHSFGRPSRFTTDSLKYSREPEIGRSSARVSSGFEWVECAK